MKRQFNRKGKKHERKTNMSEWCSTSAVPGNASLENSSLFHTDCIDINLKNLIWQQYQVLMIVWESGVHHLVKSNTHTHTHAHTHTHTHKNNCVYCTKDTAGTCVCVSIFVIAENWK